MDSSRMKNMLDSDRKNRFNEIEAARADGSITDDQYNELIHEESVTDSAVRGKYIALFVLLGTIGFFLLLS